MIVERYPAYRKYSTFFVVIQPERACATLRGRLRAARAVVARFWKI